MKKKEKKAHHGKHRARREKQGIKKNKDCSFLLRNLFFSSLARQIYIKSIYIYFLNLNN